MKKVPHLVKVTAHFICENCGDNTQIIIPEKGTSKKSYCCSATYEAYWDGDETVVHRVKKEKEKYAKIRSSF